MYVYGKDTRFLANLEGINQALHFDQELKEKVFFEGPTLCFVGTFPLHPALVKISWEIKIHGIPCVMFVYRREELKIEAPHTN